jgi:hypothetical protein
VSLFTLWHYPRVRGSLLGVSLFSLLHYPCVRGTHFGVSLFTHSYIFPVCAVLISASLYSLTLPLSLCARYSFRRLFIHSLFHYPCVRGTHFVNILHHRLRLYSPEAYPASYTMGTGPPRAYYFALHLIFRIFVMMTLRRSLRPKHSVISLNKTTWLCLAQI